MGNTTIGALTGTAGGTNVPLADMSTNAAQMVVVVRDPSPSNATPYKTVPVSALPVGITEFDRILTSRADLVAVVAPVGGVFVLPAGSYFIKNSFALNAGEGLQVNGVSVFIMGGGAGVALTGGAAGIPLIQVTGANGRVQLLTLTLNAAAANVRILEAGGEVSFCSQCVFTQLFASTTEPAVIAIGTGRLTLIGSRIQAVNRCLRNSSTGQRLVAAQTRIESEQGTAVEFDTANTFNLFTGSIIRTTIGGAGQAFFVNAAGVNVEITDCEVATATTATIIQISTLGCAKVDVRGGEFQTGNAVGTTGIQVAGPVTKELAVDGVNVQNVATWILWTTGVVAAAKVMNCTGTTGVTALVNWPVANIPTRGLFEAGNQWNAASASLFVNHQQNDARVCRRSNCSSTALMSETGITP